MIARLTGTLAETAADHVVIDVNGVGYLVLASGRTLEAIGPIGGDVMLLTELQVREDGWTLFGFGSAGEREAFRQLTSVQGVGGRVALAILSIFTPDDLARAVSSTETKGHSESAAQGRARFLREWGAARLREDATLRYVVCGHAHVPDTIEVEPGRWYLNAGDWIRHSTYLTIDASGAALRVWDRPAGQRTRA